MIEIVREGCVDVCQCDRWDLRNDLVRSHALVLMPAHDIKHPYAMAGDTRSASAHTWRSNDAFLRSFGHQIDPTTKHHESNTGPGGPGRLAVCKFLYIMQRSAPQGS